MRQVNEEAAEQIADLVVAILKQCQGHQNNVVTAAMLSAMKYVFVQGIEVTGDPGKKFEKNIELLHQIGEVEGLHPISDEDADHMIEKHRKERASRFQHIFRASDN